MEVVRLGRFTGGGRPLVPYREALDAMIALAARDPDAEDVLLLAEHPPVITVGRRGGREAIHLPTGDGVATADSGHGIEIHEIARGGKVTMHVPGQLVAYPIVRLARLDGPIGEGTLGDLPAYVRALEAAILDAARAVGIPATTLPGLAGVWMTPTRKLASIGVGILRGWTQHGLALNVSPSLTALAAVTPCALDGVQLTSLAAEAEGLGVAAPRWEDVEATLVASLRRRLRRRDGGRDAG